MKATLKRLSVCECGFRALHDHIELGAEYEIDPSRKINTVFTCGGCGKIQPVIAVATEPNGYLPEVLFQEPEASGTKMMKLTDILTHEQLDVVESILNETPDRMEASNKLRRYLGQFKDELLAKGVVSDYLAYVIAYKQWTGGDNGDRMVPGNN